MLRLTLSQLRVLFISASFLCDLSVPLRLPDTPQTHTHTHVYTHPSASSPTRPYREKLLGSTGEAGNVTFLQSLPIKSDISDQFSVVSNFSFSLLHFLFEFRVIGIRWPQTTSSVFISGLCSKLEIDKNKNRWQLINGLITIFMIAITNLYRAERSQTS